MIASLQASSTDVRVGSRSELGGQILLLEVVINGNSTNKIGRFVMRDGMLRASRAEWIDLGIAPPMSASSSSDDLLGTADLPGVTWTYNASRQILSVDGAVSRLVPTLIEGPVIATGDVPTSSTGFTLNYDIDAVASRASKSAGGTFDARIFSPWGVVSSGFLINSISGPGVSQQTSATRLDFSLILSDVGTRRRYRIGDFVTAGLNWTRPVRLGGFQITEDFSMRPDMITFPLPSISGSAAVPSTVDVLENGSRLFSRDVGAGPFEVPQLPVITGAGTLSIIVRDALGRQATVTQPFYASAMLLSPGLETFSLQVGAVRQNWGVSSDDYRQLAASAAWRRGLTPSLTLEASAEEARGVMMGGGGLIINAGDYAILNAAAAASAGGGKTGVQLVAGFQRIGGVFNFSTSITLASRNFRDIASVSGASVARLQVNANAGLTLRGLGSAGIAFLASDRGPYTGPGQICFRSTAEMKADCPHTTAQGDRTRIMSASYSTQFGRFALYATAYIDIRESRASGAVLGLTIPFGRRGSAALSGGRGGEGAQYTQVDITESSSAVGEWGYRGYASTGSAPHQFGQIQYKAPWAVLAAGADHLGGQVAVRGKARGSLSIVNGDIFAANTIDDSFAIIDVDGISDIQVLQENRNVGRTNARGLLLVPDLRAFDLNHLAIDATDVPPDVTIDTVTRAVRPQYRSGVVVKFSAQVSRGALLVLIDEVGVPIPLGSVAILKADGARYPVGYEGNSYVTNLHSDNRIEVLQPGGTTCFVSFRYHAVLRDIPKIGPLVCKVEHR